MRNLFKGAFDMDKFFSLFNKKDIIVPISYTVEKDIKNSNPFMVVNTTVKNHFSILKNILENNLDGVYLEEIPHKWEEISETTKILFMPNNWLESESSYHLAKLKLHLIECEKLFNLSTKLFYDLHEKENIWHLDLCNGFDKIFISLRCPCKHDSLNNLGLSIQVNTNICINNSIVNFTINGIMLFIRDSGTVWDVYDSVIIDE